MARSLVWLVVAYLSGSLPTAYLAGRFLRGIDIREYGSGNVGGSNVYKHVATWAGIAVGVTDILKAALPVYFALRFGNSVPFAAAVGVTAVLGHCWSPYLSFAGGRGMAAALGALLPLYPFGPVFIIVVHFAGGALRVAPLADLLALATLPVVTFLLTGNLALSWQPLAILLVVAAKRLEANRLPLPQDREERRAVLWRRLIHDRDVPRDQPWVERKPQRQ